MWLWEVADPRRLTPKLSSDVETDRRPPAVDLYTTIERWHIPVGLGTWWIGSRAWNEGPWLIAPVRGQPPAPPPSGRERRSRERITLELAGLCVGLDSEGTRAAREAGAFPVSVVHELGNPLAAARGALELVMESIARRADIVAATRIDLLDELSLVNDDIERAVAFLRSLQGRQPRSPGA